MLRLVPILCLVPVLCLAQVIGTAPSRRVFSGNTLPATCTPNGEVFFKLNAPAGQNIYGCTATNTWTLQGGAGSPTALTQASEFTTAGAIPVAAGSTGRATQQSLWLVNPATGALESTSSTPFGIVGKWLAGTIAEPTAGNTALGFKASTGVPVWRVPGGTERTVAATDGNVATATALAADPANCAAGSVAGGITAAGVAEACIPATNLNTASAIVQRDGSGNFTAGTVSAALTGNASTATALAANPTDCGAGATATAIDASGNLTCAISPVTGVTGTASEITSSGGAAPTLSIADTFRITGKTATAPMKAGTTTPATCTVGDLFYDTDATAGQNLFGCTAANTWTVQSGGSSQWTTSGSDIYYNTGKVGIGTAAPPARLTVAETSTASPRGIFSMQFSDSVDGARVGFAKARGTPAAPTSVATGDMLGRLMFRGYDGANYLEMGSIDVGVSGTVASTRVPTFMAFSTATNAAPSVLTERMRIDNAGNVGIGTTTPGSLLDVRGTLRLSGATSGHVGLAPAAAAGSTTYTLPTADGSSGQVLSTNGAGTLSWASAGGGGDITAVGNCASGDCFQSVTQNHILAGPASGGSGQATARAMVAGDIPSGVVTPTHVSAALKTGVINYTFFDLNTDLPNTVDIPSIYVNRAKAITITEVYCEINAGSASINLQRDDGSAANILSSNLSCSTSGATSTSFASGEASISASHNIDHVTVSVGASLRRLNVAIKYTVD